MKIYLASSITYATPEYTASIAKLMSELNAICEVNEYFGSADAPAQTVHLHDKKCIDECDFVIAEVSYPSLGVGYEIGYALHQNKKVFAFAEKNRKVARMITGITDPNFSFQTYDNMNEIIQIIKSLVKI